MRIRHERPMPDLDFAVTAPLALTLPGGREVAVRRWTLAWAELDESFDLPVERAELAIPFQGVDIRFPVELAAGDAPGRYVFRNLTGRQRETLALFHRSILAGKMAATDEVITALDTPVDLVPMEETEEEKTAATAGKTPRLFRIIWNVLAYALAALFIFGVIGGQIWGRLNTIPLENGRIEAALAPYTVARDAYVDEVRVGPGDRVEQGDTLVTLSNPEQAGDLEELRREIRLAERRLAEAERRLSAHVGRRTDLRGQAEREYRNAMAAQAAPGWFGAHDPARIETAWAALTAARTAELTPDDLIYDELAALEEERAADLARLKRELGALKDAVEAANIVALDAGIVREITVAPDQFATRGTQAVIVEGLSPREAIGWLPARRAAAVYPGMAAEIRWSDASGPRRVTARVAELAAGPDPLRPQEFGMIVRLETDLEADESRTLFTRGQPVRLTLERDLLGWLR